MMAAGRAASLGKRVLLLEKNAKLGEKLAITGGARCNITNATYDVHKMLANYKEAANFLFSPFSKFGVKDTFTFFEQLGLPLVVQANNRAFPKTEKASDVVLAMKQYLKLGPPSHKASAGQSGVEVKTGEAVKEILHKNGTVIGIVTDKDTYAAVSYILATGGVSHPETGSTGDGFGWLTGLGHTVKQPTPTIVPIKTSDAWSHKLAGVSVGEKTRGPNPMGEAKITFFLDGKKSFSKVGKILFTHFGLSGPTILNCAGQVGDLLTVGKVTASIDLFPELDLGALDQKIVELFGVNRNKQLKNVVREIIPPGLSVGVIELLEAYKEIHMGGKVQTVPKDHRRKLTNLLKNLPITVTGLMGFDRAVVADGGVILQEIDTKTMRSKILGNLFITGDLLHINRPSGGYSLQLCWTTGFVAGSSA